MKLAMKNKQLELDLQNHTLEPLDSFQTHKPKKKKETNNCQT